MTDPVRKTIARRYALVLFVVAVVAGLTGPTLLPHGLVWITVGVLFWVAGTIWYRTVEWPARQVGDIAEQDPLQAQALFEEVSDTEGV